MKKLLASYGRDDEFRALAEQIIGEEEKKNNRVLARSLRKTLETGPNRPVGPKALAPLLPFPEAAADFIERIEPRYNKSDIVLGATNVRVLLGLIKEFRRAAARTEGPVQTSVLWAARLRQDAVCGDFRR